MKNKNIETHLVKKTAKFPRACTHCNTSIQTGETFHLEEGKSEHLHSLLARTFCSDCYAKYGEKKLLKK